MSRSDRQFNRRSLGFEDLESKTSPSTLGFDVPAKPEQKPAIYGLLESTSSPRDSSLFQTYVQAFDEVNVERDLNTQDEVTVVDQWLMDNPSPS